MQDETGIIWVLGFDASCISDFTVVIAVATIMAEFRITYDL